MINFFSFFPFFLRGFFHDFIVGCRLLRRRLNDQLPRYHEFGVLLSLIFFESRFSHEMVSFSPLDFCLPGSKSVCVCVCVCGMSLPSGSRSLVTPYSRSTMLKADSSRLRMPRVFSDERQSTKSGLQKEVRKMSYIQDISSRRYYLKRSKVEEEEIDVVGAVCVRISCRKR